MLTEFDQGTIANIASALESVCQMIPADKDSNELRKRIADELIHSASMGRRSLIELKQSGMQIVNETAKPTRSGWFRWCPVVKYCIAWLTK
jgi:hypothetical protein